MAPSWSITENVHRGQLIGFSGIMLLPVLTALLSSAAISVSAGTVVCHGDAVPAHAGWKQSRWDSFEQTINTLCGPAGTPPKIAAGGTFTLTAQEPHNWMDSKYTLQPWQGNTHCREAMEGIKRQCWDTDARKQKSVLPIGTWDNGHESYWAWAWTEQSNFCKSTSPLDKECYYRVPT